MTNTTNVPFSYIIIGRVGLPNSHPHQSASTFSPAPTGDQMTQVCTQVNTT